MSRTTLTAIFVFVSIALIILVKESREDLSENILKKDAVILAFGDSLTYGYGATKDFSYPKRLEFKSGIKVINAGVNGELSSEGLRRLPKYLEQKPDLVILCHGGNDILRKLSHDQLKKNLQDMVRLIKNSGAKVLLVAVPDFHMFGFKALSLYEEVADEAEILLEDEVLTHIELHRELKSDYVHPNDKGYDMIADVFMEVLKKNHFIP